MKTLENIKVDHIVGMDEFKIAPRSESVGTFGLCVCTALVGVTDTEVLLIRQSPLSTFLVDLMDAFRPLELKIFTPGQFVKKCDRWVMEPKKTFLQKYNPQIIAYSETRSLNETLFSRSVLWKGGKVISGFD